MRRIFIFLIFYFLFSEAHAQIGDYRTDFAVGGSVGYMLSNVGFMPEVPQGMLGGLTGGLTFRYTSEKYFKSICALVAEVNLAQTGWKEDIKDVNRQPVYYKDDADKLNPLFYERKMTYLQIPLMARMGWGRERKGMQFFFQAGPQIGFFLNEKTEANYDLSQRNLSDRTSKVVNQETMPVENKFDYGITGGIGLEYSHPVIGHFMVEARYYYGLGNIYGNTKRDYFGRSNFSNIVIKASYLFDIAKTKNNKIK